MIVAYHRPDTLEEALRLLDRSTPKTVPLGGGSGLVRKGGEPVAVVDLQNVGLGQVAVEGNFAAIGAMARMKDLSGADEVLQRLGGLAAIEFPANNRNRATVGGLLAGGDGRSLLLTALLALDGALRWQPGDREVPLGDYLPLRSGWSQGRLIEHVRIPLACALRVERVARTPVDRPILIVAICQWPSGRVRAAVGGMGKTPVLAIDGSGANGVKEAVESALSRADDEWASAAYRSEVGGALADQMLREPVDPAGN